jgi:hypothetical protein
MEAAATGEWSTASITRFWPSAEAKKKRKPIIKNKTRFINIHYFLHYSPKLRYFLGSNKQFDLLKEGRIKRYINFAQLPAITFCVGR